MSLEREHITHSIAKFNTLMDQNRNFPTVIIPAVQQRTDSGIPTDVTPWEKTSDGTTFSQMTFAASPHTNAQIPADEIQRMTETMNEAVPAHAVIWWGHENGKDPIPLNKIHTLPPEEKAHTLQAISDQTRKTVELFRNWISPDLHRSLAKTVRIYGVWGHANKEERVTSGLSRGAQSHPDGHFHVVYFPQPQVEQRKLSETELLKQLGSWDTVIHEKFEAHIINWFRTVSQEYNPDLRISFHAKQDHGSTMHRLRINFFEGYTIKFSKRIPFNQAIDYIGYIASKYDEFYNSALDFYTNYHLSQFDTEKKLLRYEFKARYINQFGHHGISEMTNFLLSIPPTNGQYRHWQRLLEERIANEQEPQRQQELANKIHLINGLIIQNETQYINIQNNPNRYLQGLQQYHGISPEDASLLLTLSKDRLHQSDNPNQFILPLYASGSFLISNYVLTSRGIEVDSISLSTRLATTKGVVEDLEGVALRRAEGK